MAEATDPNRYQTNFESHTVGRDNAIGTVGPRKKRKKKKSTKQDGRKKRRGKKQKQEEKKVDFQQDTIGITDPMKKLRAAHPRHIIKLILRKLIEKPSFHRMLGTLGMALKSSGVSLEEYFLSNSNKLPRTLRNRMRYDINDQRVLILARLAIHKMLIREGTTLKSAIHSYGTYPDEYDSDKDDLEIQDIEPQYKNLKKGLKYIHNEQFVQQMQTENPQEILNALSYADKHKLYELFKHDLEQIDEKEGGSNELHKVCTCHVSTAPTLTANAIPTIIKYDDENTWPVMQETIDPNIFNMDDNENENANANANEENMVMIDDELKHEHQQPIHGIESSVHNALGVPTMDDIKTQASAQSNFTAPSARSIYEDDYKQEEKQSIVLNMDEENAELSEIQKQEQAAEQAKDKVNQMKKEYKQLIEKNDDEIDHQIKNKDHDRMISATYEYLDDVFHNGNNNNKDLSLLSSLQTQIDILIRYNHIGYKHLNMLLSSKPSCLPEMYVSLDRMLSWELKRENEIEILSNKQSECKNRFGGDIEELNIRKALLAREINESKVSLERIQYELSKLRKLYENARIELDEVNETTKQQELQRDAYLTKFDEKWTFEWGVRKKFHKQTKLNEAVKSDAKEWLHKLDEIKRYDTSNEIWRDLKENIWKYGNDNKKISEHYLKLNKVNKNREIMYFGCLTFWNDWYFKHTADNGVLKHGDDKKKLSKFYNEILLKGTEKNMYFELNKDLAQFEYELNSIKQKKWSYREHIYNLSEENQIDIQQTELPTNQLWKLVEYKENNEVENYKQYAYPKLYKFEQEQLELERREKIKENERQKQKKNQNNNPRGSSGHSGHSNKKSRRNLLKLAAKKQKMNKLQEEDEELERAEERKYQSQMQFINESNSHIASLPGTPSTTDQNQNGHYKGSTRMGFGAMGMSGKGDTTFNFAANNNNSQNNMNMNVNTPHAMGTNNNFSAMGISNASQNFGGMSGKGIAFGGMSTASFGMDSRQGSVSRADAFGRQRTSHTYGNYGAQQQQTPTFSKYSAYTGTPTATGTPHAVMMKRNSDISASGFGGAVTTPKPQTPNDSHNNLSGMGGSFGKFQPHNFGMDSPSTTHVLQSNYSNSSNNSHANHNYEMTNQQSFSMAQKHERL